MTVISMIFWCSLFLVCYSYIGYGILLYIVIKLRRLFIKARPLTDDPPFTPDVTLMVAAYNEEGFIREKIANTLSLNYPAGKVQIIFVTDGSSDDTNNIIRSYPQITLLYEPERKGKTMAVNRAMKYVKTPFVVFSDANTLLNKDVLICLMRHFQDEQTGAVAGEKKIIVADQAEAEGAGEGMYWKYESLLKKWDAELYSVMGAAGELFAVRTSLYEDIPADTILDDFMISFGINKKGYKVAYAPDAYAQETPSASLEDEYKRKVRISAGGFQSMSRLLDLLNIFRYPKITWQYVSHRVSRWTVAPICLLLALLTNIILCVSGAPLVYWFILLMQVLFYGMAFVGYILAKKQVKSKLFYIPFYFVFMNVAVYQGFGRFLRKKQSAVWDRSQRQLTAG
ncbi:glycosyltransferase family 2 protein [Chitinophaga sp. S165]|uniref:glycosyltransferase family 2 protein n=1 Tax=Chitinophaga sp. S165 TaxID=2135462 RepID=UPI000D70A1BA|nr:glycosyltransferase family 2 protein [Chitinophaga sp. S165]PWV55792.1 cellulose synthase/poly-beta-1,6-N-acetylglucosamine synthase-like glycosyltransferase [Chitinophaga sp. S165]